MWSYRITCAHIHKHTSIYRWLDQTWLATYVRFYGRRCTIVFTRAAAAVSAGSLWQSFSNTPRSIFRVAPAETASARNVSTSCVANSVEHSRDIYLSLTLHFSKSFRRQSSGTEQRFGRATTWTISLTLQYSDWPNTRAASRFVHR